MNSLAIRFARPLSIRRSLSTLARVSTNVLVISPSTRGSIAFAQALGRTRPCVITRGPITAAVPWPFDDCLRTAAEIAQAFTGQPALPRTVISFPDQSRVTSTCVMVPFVNQPHAFSTLEALLVLRHRPRVYALSASGRHWGFRLIEVQYEDAFDAEGRLLSLGSLVGRLLLVLAADLARPPADWLARPHLMQKSERALWIQAREELKDIECPVHATAVALATASTSAALAAVVERQKVLIGTSLP
jgi:hypothetical protein